MDEIPGIGSLSGEEQGLSRPETPLLTRKGDQLQRLARKQVEGPRPPQPRDLVVERHSARPPAAAIATSL